MFTHNIFDLLKRFSGKELLRLENFLRSPYHNKSKKILLLFNELKKFYPDFTSKKLSKEWLALKINPGLKFNESTLRDLLSGLLSCLEEFLIIEELNKNQPDKLILLLKSYIEKNQAILFQKNFKKASDLLENEGHDSVYYYNNSLLNVCNLNYNIIHKPQNTAKMLLNNQYIRNSYIVNIFIHYITELISTYLKIIISESKFKLERKVNIALTLINKTDLKNIKELFRNDKNNYFIIELYSNMFSAFQNLNDLNHFQKYKASFFKSMKSLSSDEISYHYSMLISFCILSNSVSGGKNNYDKELLIIYESFLKGKFFSDNKTGWIDENLYRNILLLALRLRKFKWTFSFITTYSKYLHPGKRGNLLKLSYGEYYFYIGSNNKSKLTLNKSFCYLREIKEESFILKYEIKNLYLMLYYELHHDDSVIFQINNYRKFLMRNKLVTGERKEKINKFLNAFEKLVYVRAGNKPVKSSDLIINLENLKGVSHKDWLLEKYEEIK